MGWDGTGMHARAGLSQSTAQHLMCDNVVASALAALSLEEAAATSKVDENGQTSAYQAADELPGMQDVMEALEEVRSLPPPPPPPATGAACASQSRRSSCQPSIRACVVRALSSVQALAWPSRYADLASQLGVRWPKGILLHGPPGCGKTAAVHAVARQCSAAVHLVTAASILGSFTGLVGTPGRSPCRCMLWPDYHLPAFPPALMYACACMPMACPPPPNIDAWMSAGESERRLREAFATAAKDAASGRCVVILLDEASAPSKGTASFVLGWLMLDALDVTGLPFDMAAPALALLCAGGCPLPKAQLGRAARGTDCGAAAHTAGRLGCAWPVATKGGIPGQRVAGAASPWAYLGGWHHQPAQRVGPGPAASRQVRALRWLPLACCGNVKCSQGACISSLLRPVAAAQLAASI